MSNTDLLRRKMVEGQVLPHHAHEDPLIWAFMQVHRDKCVDPAYQKVAYMEDFVPQGYGRYLMPASVLSRSIRALNIQEKDTAFVIGAGLGYAAMILSYLAKEVIAFEPNTDLLRQGQALMDQEGFHTVLYKKMASFQEFHSSPKEADVIFIKGALSAVPAPLKECLREGGRLIAFISTPLEGGRFPMVQVTLFERHGSTFTEKPLFLTEMPLFPSSLESSVDG